MIGSISQADRKAISEFTPVQFVPRRYLSNAHLQTIVGNYLQRRNALPPPTAELVQVSPPLNPQPGSEVLCHCHWQAAEVRASRPAVILLHGLEGSSRSQYIVGNANKLWRAGFSVIRMNMRNCGGPEYDMVSRTATLYHSGLSSDVDAAMHYFLEREQLKSISLVGYSMGGNLVLKLAGEMGEAAPPQLKAVVGVSPAIDLAPSADALHRPANRIYERKFLRALLKRYRRKAVLFPRAYDPNRTTGVHSLREFDDRITALYSGFRSADDYYFRAAAARVVERIAVPTLVLHSADDPFVVLTQATTAALRANPNITLLETQHGGHCAFLADPDPAYDDDGYWAETTLRNFLLAHA